MCKAVLSLCAACALALAASLALAAGEPPLLSLNAIAVGASGRADLGIGMLELRATLSPQLYLSAGPAILTVEHGDTEHQLRAAATLQVQLGPLRVDDRNLWVFSDAGTTRYRNRLRLTAPAEIGGRTLRFQLVNEGFYEERGRGWFRNLAGAGVGLDVNRSFSVDGYWMVQDDEHRPRSSLLLVVFVARLR
jgi:hypothetical protein